MFKRPPDETEAGSDASEQADLGQSSLNDSGSSSQRHGESATLKKRLLLDDNQPGRHNKRLMANYELYQGSRDQQGDSSYVSPRDRHSTSSELDEQQLKPCDKELCNLQQQSPSKHLVRTLSDLPKFVTIEGYRVASYTISGEPHLCLPHLLQYIQQKYPLDKVIDTFERIVASFNSATPKQVEGFVKAIVLPPGTNDCPLIKRSDAERVCLALYDQFGSDRSSGDEDESDKGKDVQVSPAKRDKSQPPVAATSPKDAQSKGDEISLGFIHQDTSSDSSKEEEEGHQAHIEDSSHRSGLADGAMKSPVSKGPEASASSAQSESQVGPHPDEPRRSSNVEGGADEAPHHSQAKRTSEETSRESEGNRIFGSGDQNMFLSFARAATSTLRIKLYHRCFGKCNGVYYPTRLEDSESRCIECSECHRLFSPRRFIGHTHKSKEDNVCHWGFNSYLWRHYIYLCKNQDINQLDDDELLVQLNTLKAVSEKSPSESEGNEGLDINVDDPKSDDEFVDRSSHITRFQEKPNISMPISLVAGVSSDRSLCAGPSSHPINIVKPTIFEPSTSGGGVATVFRPSSSLVEKHKAAYQRSMFPWPLRQPLTGPYMASGSPFKMTSEQNTHITNTRSNTLQFPYSSLLSNPLFLSHQYKSIPTSSHLNLHDFGSSQLGLLETGMGTSYKDRIPVPHTSLAMPSTSGYRRVPAASELIRRDMFVSSSMAAYLSSRGLDSDLIRDIIEQALDAINKSRMMF